jgi:hypothetical protein
MMSAVKQESLAYDAMKSRVKELEEIQSQIPFLQKQVQNFEREKNELIRLKEESDHQSTQVRLDLQRLNDLYNGERKQHLDSQHSFLQLEQKFTFLTKDISQLRRENDNFREQNHLLTKQFSTISQQYHEEKKNLKETIQFMERRVEETETMKRDLSQHFWNLNQELQQSKDLNQQFESNLRELNEQSQQLRFTLLLQTENFQMQFEDISSFKVENQMRVQSEMKEIHESYRYQSQNILEEFSKFRQDMTEKLRMYECQEMEDERVRDMLVKEMNQTKAQFVEQEQTLARTLQENETLRLQIDIQNKALLVSEEKESVLASYETKFQHMKTELEEQSQRYNLEIMNKNFLQTKYHFSEEQMKLLTEKNTLLFQKLTDAEEELQRGRECSENVLMRIEEKTMQFHVVIETFSQEFEKSQQVIQLLKQELEKRLTEFGKLRQENEILRESQNVKEETEKTEFLEKQNKMEKLFKLTIESERNKFTIEMKNKINRIKSLEKDKQEMLEETSELMRVIEKNELMRKENDERRHELQCEVNDLKKMNEELVCERRDLMNGKHEMESQLELIRTEKNQIALQYSEDISRLDGLVKESRGIAMQQMEQLTTQYQDLNFRSQQEQDELKKMLQERNQEIELMRQFKDQELSSKTENEQKILKDYQNLKKDFQNLNQKYKEILIQKQRLDEEGIHQRRVMEEKKREYEQKVCELIETLQEKEILYENQKQALVAEVETAQTKSKKNQMLLFEFETISNRSKLQLQKLQDTYHKLEKESHLEIKKLKQNFQNLKQSYDEINENYQKLQFEYSTQQQNYETLQNNSQNTMTELISEIKSTEDILMKERSNYQKDLQNYSQHITELQFKNEEIQNKIKEKVYETENNKNNYENITMKYSIEMNRMKLTTESLEKRNIELEKTHSENRNKVFELKNQMMKMEQEQSIQKSEIQQLEKVKKKLEFEIQKLRRELEEREEGDGRRGGGEEGEDSDDVERWRRRREQSSSKEVSHTTELKRKSYHDFEVEDEDVTEGEETFRTHEEEEIRANDDEEREEGHGDDYFDHMSAFSAHGVGDARATSLPSRSNPPLMLPPQEFADPRALVMRTNRGGTESVQPIDQSTGNEEGMDDINEAIARTQRFLSNRGSKSSQPHPHHPPVTSSRRPSHDNSSSCTTSARRSSTESLDSLSHPQQHQQYQHYQQQHLSSQVAMRRSYNEESEGEDDFHSMRLSVPTLLPATPPTSMGSLPVSYEDYGDEDSPGDDVRREKKSYSAPVLSADGGGGQENGKSARGGGGGGGKRKVKSSSTKRNSRERLKENNENEGEAATAAPSPQPLSKEKETAGGFFPKILTTRNPSLNR